MKPRWPRALRVLTEESKADMYLYTLACFGAECHKPGCSWRGALRSDRDEAGRDGIDHLLHEHGVNTHAHAGFRSDL